VSRRSFLPSTSAAGRTLRFRGASMSRLRSAARFSSFRIPLLELPGAKPVQIPGILESLLAPDPASRIAMWRWGSPTVEPFDARRCGYFIDWDSWLLDGRLIT